MISVWRIRSLMISMRLKSASVISMALAVIWSRDSKPLIVMTRPQFVECVGMRPSNPPANVTLFKNLESVAKAPQLLGSNSRLDSGKSEVAALIIVGISSVGQPKTMKLRARMRRAEPGSGRRLVALS
jgi:hypothetical protein